MLSGMLYKYEDMHMRYNYSAAPNTMAKPVTKHHVVESNGT